MSEKFEKVFTVYRYHDQPRSGIANYNDQPHKFEFTWDDAQDDYARVSVLSPISSDTFQLALEGWAIWMRWIEAFKEGKVQINPNAPSVLPEDQARYDEVAGVLKIKLSESPEKLQAIGTFRPIKMGAGPNGAWEVSWKPA